MAEIDRCMLSVTALRTFPDLWGPSVSTAMKAEVIVSKTDSHKEQRNDIISIKKIDTVIVNMTLKISSGLYQCTHKKSPKNMQLFGLSNFILILSSNYFCSAKRLAWYFLAKSSWMFLGAGEYLVNSIENSPLPLVAERKSVE